jgi:hypothetical protein
MSMFVGFKSQKTTPVVDLCVVSEESDCRSARSFDQERSVTEELAPTHRLFMLQQMQQRHHTEWAKSFISDLKVAAMQVSCQAVP